MFIITSSGNLVDDYIRLIKERKLHLTEDMRDRLDKYHSNGFTDITFFYFHLGNMEVRITSTSLMIFEIEIEDLKATLRQFPRELLIKTLSNCGIFVECPIPILEITRGHTFTTRGFVTKKHEIGAYNCCTVNDWNNILATPNEYRFLILAAEMSRDRNYILQRIMMEPGTAIMKKLKKIYHELDWREEEN